MLASPDIELVVPMLTNKVPMAAQINVPESAQAATKPVHAASNEKLSKLEDELAKLREMIAAVVTKQDNFESSSVPGVPAGVPPPPPPPPMMGMMPPPGVDAPMGAGAIPAEYVPFQKMLKMRVPPGAVQIKMLAKGLDPAVLGLAPGGAPPGM